MDDQIAIDDAIQEMNDARDKEIAETAFLEEEAPAPIAETILKDLSAKATRLMELKWEADEKEEEYLEAKKQYDEFRCVTLPTFMKMTGLTRIDTAGGARVLVESKYYCKPNKNEEDMSIIEGFLVEHGMASLVKKEAVVEANLIEKLRDASIPYTEEKEVNTNSLKAWLKDQIGDNGGQVQFTMADIPNCIHFIKMDECVIKV